MIRTVIRLQTGEVMVFYTEGEQAPEYQGQYEEVRARILQAAPFDTRFFHWFDCADEPVKVPRANW